MEETEIISVIIGQQEWTNKNLATVRFRNGDVIPHIENNTDWKKASELGTPAWCCFDNDTYFGGKFGFLYNWHAVMDPRGLAPKGWHIPSDIEWMSLISFLGGKDVAGGKLKEQGTSHWLAPNTDATDDFGFSALPGGDRGYSGVFSGYDYYGTLWSSTKGVPEEAWAFRLNNKSGYILRGEFLMGEGLYVRCIKD